MKTLIMIFALSIFCFSKIFSTDWELEASYKNKPATSIYKVFIRPINIGTGPSYLYDGNFNPVPLSDTSYLGKEFDGVYFNAVYPDAGSLLGTINGLVYYGKYYIEFREKNPDQTIKQVLASATIDFRDGDYGYPLGASDVYTGVGNPQDFYIYYDFTQVSTGGGVQSLHDKGLYFKYGDSELKSKTDFGIWELLDSAAQLTKSQNTTRFKNFTLSVYGNDASATVTVTEGATNYIITGNNSISANNTSGATTLNTDYRSSSGKFFSSWVNGTTGQVIKLFDTHLSETLDLNHPINRQVRYISSSQYNTITGPGSFDHKYSIPYYSTHNGGAHPPSGRFYYLWFVRWDSLGGVWQNTYGDSLCQITPSAQCNNCFTLKCYMQDSAGPLAIWSSNELHVVYYGCWGEEQRAFRSGDDNQATSSNQTSSESIAFNPDLLTPRQKKALLLPIEESVRNMPYKFRWKETDPNESGDTFADLDSQIVAWDRREQALKAGNQAMLKSKPKENLAKQNVSLPRAFALDANYPNPFNPSTTISYALPKAVNVSVKIYDVMGREIAELVNETKPAGFYKITFDASKLASGVYIYRIEAGEFVQSRKMLLVK